jgi:hypothetical protein
MFRYYASQVVIVFILISIPETGKQGTRREEKESNHPTLHATETKSRSIRTRQLAIHDHLQAKAKAKAKPKPRYIPTKAS